MILLLCYWSVPITRMEQTSSLTSWKILCRSLGQKQGCHRFASDTSGRIQAGENVITQIVIMESRHRGWQPPTLQEMSHNLYWPAFWKKTFQATACQSNAICSHSFHIVSARCMYFLLNPCISHVSVDCSQLWEPVTELVELIILQLK